VAQQWIQRSRDNLKQLRQLLETPDQDRLDLLRVMRFTLGALGQSLAGWMQWINSTEVMSNFTQEELEEMERTIMEMVDHFIEYDIKVTEDGVRKGLAKRRVAREAVRFIV